MAGLSDLLGAGDAAKQLLLWGLFNQMLSALTQPYLSSLTQDVQSAHPVNPLSAADAATAVNRAFLDSDTGAAYAAKSGINPEVFQIMRDLAGDAPSPQELVEALRRGLIQADGKGSDSTSFEQGISETNLLDKWTDVMRGLAAEWPTPADALRATLNGQVPMDQGQSLYEKWGGDPQWFQIMFDTEGNAPTPLEASEMALRGIIPWDGTGPEATTYQQAFLEGPWRNKWSDSYRQLSTYIPTQGEISEFLQYGAIDDATALKMLAQRGVTGEVAAALIARAHHLAIFEWAGLTVSTILDMYYDQLMSESDTAALLQDMNISETNAHLLLSYTDLRREISALQSGVSRISSLYIGHKITSQEAHNALTALNVPADQAGPIIAVWDTERAANVKTLTASEIVDAFYYLVMTQEEATRELINIGYTPYDAWVLLSNKAENPLDGKPGGPPPATGDTVHTGTT